MWFHMNESVKMIKPLSMGSVTATGGVFVSKKENSVLFTSIAPKSQFNPH